MIQTKHVFSPLKISNIILKPFNLIWKADECFKAGSTVKFDRTCLQSILFFFSFMYFISPSRQQSCFKMEKKFHACFFKTVRHCYFRHQVNTPPPTPIPQKSKLVPNTMFQINCFNSTEDCWLSSFASEYVKMLGPPAKKQRFTSTPTVSDCLLNWFNMLFKMPKMCLENSMK